MDRTTLEAYAHWEVELRTGLIDILAENKEAKSEGVEPQIRFLEMIDQVNQLVQFIGRELGAF